MKKYIALTFVLVIVLSILGLSGCSGDSGMITLYEFKDNYEEGTSITKNMLTKPLQSTWKALLFVV